LAKIALGMVGEGDNLNVALEYLQAAAVLVKDVYDQAFLAKVEVVKLAMAVFQENHQVGIRLLASDPALRASSDSKQINSSFS
jgi:hypothetical protein